MGLYQGYHLFLGLEHQVTYRQCNEFQSRREMVDMKETLGALKDSSTAAQGFTKNEDI